MLARVAPALLGMLEFPLAGAHEASDVRARPLRAGLAAATAPESQDVCFLGGGGGGIPRSPWRRPAAR